MYKLMLICAMLACVTAGCDGNRYNGNQNASSLSIQQAIVYVQQKHRSPAYDLWKAKQGDDFLVYEVSIQNRGTRSLIVSPDHFNVVGSSGNIYGAFYTKNHPNLLANRRLKSYRKMKADILFEVPTSETDVTLQFVPDFSEHGYKIVMQ